MDSNPLVLDSLSSTLSTSHNRPSIFELLAADELRDLVQPAFRYLLAFFAQRHPRYLLRLINRHEEVYAILMLLIERHHLNKYDASFSEHFYNLHISPTPPHPTPRLDLLTPSYKKRRLTQRQRYFYLAAIVGIPYLRSKLQALYESLTPPLPLSDPDEPIDTHPLFTLPRTTPLKLFKRVYPWANLAWEVGMVGYDVGYMFDWKGVGGWRPWMRGARWAGVGGMEVLRDEGGFDPPILPSLSPPSPPSLPTLRRLLALALTLLRRTLHSSLPLSLLTLKFLQWWYSPTSPRAALLSGSGTVGGGDGMGGRAERVRGPRMVWPLRLGEMGKSLKDVEAEEVEEVEEEDEEGSDSDSDDASPQTPPTAKATKPTQLSELPYGTCPLCLGPWANPTITSTGYVGCYLCLYGAVKGSAVEGKEGGRCPVTGVWMIGGVGELRKVNV